MRSQGNDWFCTALVISALLVCAHASAVPVFEDEVAPILKEKCSECHNGEKRKGELDLSSAAGLMKGGEHGPAIEVGEPDRSHLFGMIHSGEMPKKGGPLPESQVGTIREWIVTGAAFREAPEIAGESLNQHDVIPIVMLRCVSCHGPQRQDGGLDIRTPASMQRGGKSGPAFVMGDPDGSHMIQRIENETCPPQNLLLKFFVKRPPKSEVKILRDWIAAGAPVEDIEPDIATTEPDPLVTDEDREHWAFQPPKANGNVTSIDFFIEAKLKQAGLFLSTEAPRDTLIRRAYLDLVGMPPSLEEWEYWRGTADENWYSAMIDRLLESPHYGERWGRYWLDVAGYADSEGGVSADPVREVAWKYRDYVIKAFNEDKPYDRFLVEQIAGDELIDVAKADIVTQEMVDNLVATGFLRMGIDQTGSRTMNFVPERLGVINDAINVLGSGVMGLTMECVKCHSHKYDPIPQRDYYRLKAVLQGAYDENNWLSFKTRSMELGTPERVARLKEVNPPLEKELKSATGRYQKAYSAMQDETMRQHYPDVTDEDLAVTRKALKKASNQRSLIEAQWVEKYLKAEIVPDGNQPKPVIDSREAVKRCEQEIAGIRSRMEPSLEIRALWDLGDPSPTYILRRGEFDKPGRLVGPGVPAVLTDGKTPFDVEPPFPEGTPKTGRRLALAKWLTQPDHPLTSRVMVNRIWSQHFGTGIVESLENFGVKGARPSHPKLLDWLAVKFVEEGWSIKEVHRIIMNSRTYRQASTISDEANSIDPENRLLSHMPMRRMDAEALRDSILFVSGKLDDSPGGPPDGVSVDREGQVSVNSTSSGKWRRSIYAQYRRTELPTMMDTFDYPEMGPNCVERSVSTVSPQALLLKNNNRIHFLASVFADRVRNAMGDEVSPDALVKTVYRLALNRDPSSEEARLGKAALKELEKEWRGEKKRALDSYCHAILNSAAFLYID